MSLYDYFTRPGPSGFGHASTAEEVTAGLDLSGKTMLLTGCNAGIGFETLRVLTQRGAHIIATGRSEEKAREACIRAGGETTPLACELSEPASVRACIAKVQAMGLALDAIICNAGIMALPRLQQKHGYELQFFTNHLGHFILVNGLLTQLAANGRVVMVSSRAHNSAPAEGIQLDNLSGERGYQPWAAYGQSKLANLLFARQLAVQLRGTQRTANAIHPGVIRTKLSRHMGSFVDGALALAGPIALKSIAQGAATQCYVATHPALEGISGKYFADCNEAPTSALGQDLGLAARLWDVSEQIAAKV